MNTATNTTFSLEIVSDTICPWCYIGKKRLDNALDLIGDEIAFDIHWRPFELNPNMPRGGTDRRVYRTHKFGSWERSQQLDKEVMKAGADEGLDFRHDRMTTTPNTLASHVLIRLAAQSGQQNAVVKAVFKAYFTDGLDVGDPTVLADIGAANGLIRAEVMDALNDETLRQQIKAEAAAYARGGVSSVPTVMLNSLVFFSGAQPPALIADGLRKAAADIAAGSQFAAGA